MYKFALYGIHISSTYQIVLLLLFGVVCFVFFVFFYSGQNICLHNSALFSTSNHSDGTTTDKFPPTAFTPMAYLPSLSGGSKVPKT